MTPDTLIALQAGGLAFTIGETTQHIVKNAKDNDGNTSSFY